MAPPDPSPTIPQAEYDELGDLHPRPVNGGSEAEDLLGAPIGDQYLILDIIARGAMGVIYRAQQTSVRREVAIKILDESPLLDERVRRFKTEARIVGQLRHPNTIRLYDFGSTDDGRLFIVTELLHGETLRARLERGSLSIEEALRFADQICGSLNEAHVEGIVHRDLKPENVFLDRVGGETHAKVLDFGIAKQVHLGVNLTPLELFLGTPAYMAPEQISGLPVDARSDVYALGVLIYEMVSGELPFRGDSSVAVLYKHMHELPRPLSKVVAVPSALDALITEMLSKAPRDRPRSMEIVRSRLRNVFALDSAAARAEEQSAMREAQLSVPLCVRDPWARWGAILGALAVVILFAVGFVRSFEAWPGTAHGASVRSTLVDASTEVPLMASPGPSPADAVARVQTRHAAH
jgi:serine/threonine-protein kinase